MFTMYSLIYSSRRSELKKWFCELNISVKDEFKWWQKKVKENLYENSRFQVNSPVEEKVLGSLRCHDGDGDANVKKAIGLIRKTTKSARASRFFVHFFTVTVRLGREISYFHVYGGQNTRWRIFVFRLYILGGGRWESNSRWYGP